VEAIAKAVVSRLLHEPTIRLRTLGGESSHASLEVLRELFALEEQAPADAPPASAEEPAAGLAQVHDLRVPMVRRRRER